MSRKCGENHIWSRKEKRCVRMRGYKGEVPEDIRADIMDRLTADLHPHTSSNGIS